MAHNPTGKNQFEDLTEKQRKFAEFYIELSNGTRAAIQAGYAESGAHVEASRALKNPKVQDYIADLQRERRERIQSRLANMAEEAVEQLFSLAITAESESVRIQALKDIMDRSGYKAVERVESKNETNAKIEFGFVDPKVE